MSNNSNNQNAQNNQNEQNYQNPLDPKVLVKNLTSANITIPVYGAVLRATCEQLEAAVEDMFQNKLGFPEMDHALIYPIMDERGRDVCEMKSFFYFNTSMDKSSVTRNGNPGPGAKTILDLAPIKSVKGEFSTSKKFTETMATIAVLDDNGNIPIKSVADKRIALVEVDFFLLMALCLNIGEDQPYNFTVLSVDAGNSRSNGYENAVVAIMKYIDNNRRYRRNNGSSRKIDYRAMDKAMIEGGIGGRRNY